MQERIADGAVVESPASLRPSGPSPALKRAQAGRSWALWTMAGGFGLLFFGAGISANLLLGGVAMILVGALVLGFFALRIRALRESPWDDAEIDAWERTEMRPRP